MASLPDSLLITDHLVSRPVQPVEQDSFKSALREIAVEIPNGKQRVLTTLVQTARRLTDAGSAGVTALFSAPFGEERLRLGPIAGELAPYAGFELTLDCPCGYVVRRARQAELFANPASYFTQLRSLPVEIKESLCVPLQSDGRTMGTLWAMSHSAEKKFTMEDSRVLQSLAAFSGAAIVVARDCDAEPSPHA